MSELPFVYSFNSAVSTHAANAVYDETEGALEINYCRTQKARILYSLLPFHYTGSFEEILKFVALIIQTPKMTTIELIANSRTSFPEST